jgi:hypothetical protein
MLQDRNIHRDAQALRKAVTIPLIVPAFGVDQDEPIYSTIPPYNWRLSDLSTFRNNLANAVLTVSATAVPPRAVFGSGAPHIGVLASVNFSVGEYWRRFGDNLINVAPVASQPWDNGNVVLDGLWGVFLFIVNESNDINQLVPAQIQGFATEELALANCPKVPQGGFPSPLQNYGRLSIVTILATGGDFITSTTLTNAAAQFNNAPIDGHVVSIPTGTSPQPDRAVLGQRLKDESGTTLLQGRGGPGGDMLVVGVKCFGGASVLTGPAQAVVEYRPWPAGGEGVGDASVSQNRPDFTP